MCFSNLPIEFDEHGDPYLAEEADEVQRPACGCAEGEVSLAEDPAAAYDALIQTVHDDVRKRLQAAEEAPHDGRKAEGD